LDGSKEGSEWNERTHFGVTKPRELDAAEKLNLFDDEPREQAEQAPPDGPITLGIDGGDVRAEEVAFYWCAPRAHSKFDCSARFVHNADTELEDTALWRIWVVLLLALLELSSAAGFQEQNPPSKRDLRLESRLPETSPPTKPASIPRGYAVVIGIAKYKNLAPAQNLRFPESDAEAMYRVLISKEGGAFPAENVHLLKGSQASLVNIRHELEEWLPSVAQPEDRVIVYFAGHGFVDHQQGYLAAWDVNGADLETTAYPMSAVGEVLGKKVKAHWKVLLVDACHSGKITPETTDEEVDAKLKNLPLDFLTITATTARESSYEDSKLSTGFGLFTYYLVQGIKGNADNDPCDGVITSDELIEYVRLNVRNYAKARHVSQTPTTSGDYPGNMVLGVHPGACQGADTSNVSMVGTAVIESNMDNVDVYLDGGLVGKISAGKSLSVPGLSTGLHKVDGVRPDYEPDHREVMIAPGQEVTVSLRIRYAKVIKKSALDLGTKGEGLLNSHRSSWNPLVTEMVRRQTESELKQARDLFTRALQEDPKYSTAAYNLGQVDQLLSDEDGSMKAYRRAIQIDPSYVDARQQLAAALIENGDADEAIRQLNEAIRLDPDNDLAYSMLSRAYLDKGVWKLCIENADRSLALNANNDQAYLWKADATRQLAAEIPKPPEGQKATRRTQLYQEARDNYRTFLKLTNYSTPVYSWIAFHFIGFHLGSRNHANRTVAYNSQRSTGYLGLCLCDQNVGELQQGKDHCQQALKYDPDDPIAYFELGNVFRDLFNNNYDRHVYRCDYLQLARDSYARMIRINSGLVESKNAKTYIENIDVNLPIVRKMGCAQQATTQGE
jgi:tetratricopeptide (TPR) repeat protein